ncbi:MAG: hypothetical protein QXL91_02515 [Candidatus Bathyarchaeia archaeon]|nr:hypothetical protein [Candidatus Bathyarchaeota archaeon]
MQSAANNKIDRSKASRTSMVKRRIAQLKEELKADTQKIRLKTIEQLQEIFNMASALAKGEVKYQTEDGKPQKLTLSQRQKWARVAAYIAQIINSVSNTFDERQIDEDLAKLEELINEAAAKTKTQKAGTSAN